MKPRPHHLNRTIIGCISFGVSIAIAGCTTMPPPRQWDGCGAAGAVVGAVAGAGTGIGVAYSQETHPHTNVLIATGVGGGVIGGIIGAAVGHEICDPLLPPPPPPPMVAAAPPPLPPPPPPVEEHHEKLVLRGVHFDFNKSRIRPGDAAILDEAADILKQHPNVTSYDDGYCDAIGSEEYNLKLSQRRAEAVARYLEDKGIPESRIIPRGFGKTNFVAPNDTDEGRAQNRRVELKPVQ
jgi:hypothetical protein